MLIYTLILGWLLRILATTKLHVHYEKAIELDPSFESSYLNLVALILNGESAIVEEMNSLGTSRKDNLRYDELKGEREELYKECVPVLKGLIEVNNKNEEAIKTLMNIYGTLGENQGYMEMKNYWKPFNFFFLVKK